MTSIPQARLNAFADGAASFGDVRDTMTAISVIVADRATLEREGRKNALEGANRLLAGLVRRLCASAAPSREEAELKSNVLALLREVYHLGSGDANRLMVVMMDAAIALETEAWPAPPSQH